VSGRGVLTPGVGVGLVSPGTPAPRQLTGAWASFAGAPHQDRRCGRHPQRPVDLVQRHGPPDRGNPVSAPSPTQPRKGVSPCISTKPTSSQRYGPEGCMNEPTGSTGLCQPLSTRTGTPACCGLSTSTLPPCHILRSRRKGVDRQASRSITTRESGALDPSTATPSPVDPAECARRDDRHEVEVVDSVSE
jgi:hypothetical protein